MAWWGYAAIVVGALALAFVAYAIYCLFEFSGWIGPFGGQ